MKKLEIKAVIFDMDGVIFDSEQVYFDAFFIAAQKYHLNFTHEFVANFAGKTSAECIQLLTEAFKNIKTPSLDIFLHEWRLARERLLIRDGLGFKTGFLPLFEFIQAKNYPVALVTSAHRADVEENFARNKAEAVLKSFNKIITLEDVKHPKPNPEPYQKAAKALNIAPEHCLVIEDSIPGVTAALAAGANTIMINYQQPNEVMLKQLLRHVTSHQEILDWLSTVV